MTAAELRASATNLRSLAGRGILRVTHNGKTVQYESTEKMLDAADRLDQRADLMTASSSRSPYRPSRLTYSRR